MKSTMNRMKRQKYLFIYTSILPILFLYLIFRIIPIIQNFYYSFFNSTLLNPTADFCGFDNFKRLLHDTNFLQAIRNTAYFAVTVTFFGVVLSLGLALLLDKRTKMNPFYETVYFIPVITPMVPVSVVWKWIYDPTYGLLNYILSWFGVKPIAWLIYPNTAMTAIIIMSVWKILGYNMLIFLVGLRNIPLVYHEAAMIDGATPGQIRRMITLPLLRPITLLVLVITTINSFNVFTQVYIMTSGAQGASGGAVRVLVYDIYENAFRYYKTGYAAAEAVLMFLIILVLTIIQLRLGKEEK